MSLVQRYSRSRLQFSLAQRYWRLLLRSQWLKDYSWSGGGSPWLTVVAVTVGVAVAVAVLLGAPLVVEQRSSSNQEG